MFQRDEPGVSPFLTVFVPLVKYGAAADNGARLARVMNRFNKGKSLKAGTFVITISVGSMPLPQKSMLPKSLFTFSSHSLITI